MIGDDTSDIIMDDNIQLRRHQTQAARQPTVTQRLSDILRNRRLKIGGRSNTTTASSLSDSLTLSESNTHSSAHRNVRWGDVLLSCSSLLKVVPLTIYCAHSSTKIISWYFHHLTMIVWTLIGSFSLPERILNHD